MASPSGEHSPAGGEGGVHDPTLSDSPRRSQEDSAAAAGSAAESAASSASASITPVRPAGALHGQKFQVAKLFIPLGNERDGVVYYTISVETTEGDKWSVRKRFSAFERLHAILLELWGHRGFPPGADLPPKKFKFFVSHVSDHFIEERRCLLESYLQKMLLVSEVVKSDVWMEFLSSDELPHFVPPQVDEVAAAAALEDCEVTSVCIPQTRLMSDHVLFQVDVVNAKKRKSFSKWTVLKRFGQFFELDGILREEFAHNDSILAQLPASPQRASKLIYDHSDLHFIEHRRVLLENYLHKLLRIRAVAQNEQFLAFLGVQI